MALATECSKNEDLVEKLSKLSVRKTSKKLRRRDNKISEYKTQIEILQENSMPQSKELTKLEKHLEYSQHVSERNRAARCPTSN